MVSTEQHEEMKKKVQDLKVEESVKFWTTGKCVYARISPEELEQCQKSKLLAPSTDKLKCIVCDKLLSEYYGCKWDGIIRTLLFCPTCSLRLEYTIYD